MPARKHRPVIEEFEYHCRFLPVPDWDGYVACEDGTVWSNKKHGKWTRIEKNTTTEYGYRLVIFADHGKAKIQPIHRIVARTFLGPRPEGMQVRHLNGDKLDNRLENLKYGTPKENVADKKLHGTQTRGQDHPGAKLSDDDVMEIRLLSSLGTKRKILCIGYDVGDGMISQIVSGNTWKHLPVLPYEDPRFSISDSVVREIRNRKQNGETISGMSRSMGLSKCTVARIANRQSYKHVLDVEMP